MALGRGPVASGRGDTPVGQPRSLPNSDPTMIPYHRAKRVDGQRANQPDAMAPDLRSITCQTRYPTSGP